MKRIFTILLLCIIVLCTLVVPCFAYTGGSLGNYQNLLTDSNWSSVNYNGSTTTVFDVNLKTNTDYTFIALNQPSDRLLIAPIVESNGVNYVYSEDSKNFMYLDNNVTTINGITFESTKYGNININGTSTGATTYYLTNFYVPKGTYVYKVFSDISLNGSNFYSGFTNQNTGRSGGDYGSGATLVSNGDLFTFAVTVGSGRTFNYHNIFPSLTEGSVTEFSRGYSDVFYVDNNISMTTFKTPRKFSNRYVLGLSDPLQDNGSNPFDRFTSSENGYFLVEGLVNYDTVYDIIYDDIGTTRYNAGFSDGESKGMTDGLNASGMVKNVIFTVLSAPFIIISNAFNFDIFGISVYSIICILLTLMLVAFVIKIFKKGF